MAFFGEGFSRRLRDRLFQHLQAVPYSYYKNAQTGDIIQRCTSDVETVRRFVQMQLVQVVRTVCMAVTAFAIMLPISGRMTALSSCFFPLLIAGSFVYFRRVQAQFLKADQAEGELSTVIQENLTGMRVVRAFAAERAQLAVFTQKNETFRRTITHLNTLMGMFWGATDTLGYLQIAPQPVLRRVVCRKRRADTWAGDAVFHLHLHAHFPHAPVWPRAGRPGQGRRGADAP